MRRRAAIPSGFATHHAGRASAKAPARAFHPSASASRSSPSVPKGRFVLHQDRETSPQAGSVTQPVSAPMSRSRVFAYGSGVKIGYGHVSTRDQNPDAQRDALTAAGCDQIFVDKASGKLARRPGLDKALLSASRAGDLRVQDLSRTVSSASRASPSIRLWLVASSGNGSDNTCCRESCPAGLCGCFRPGCGRRCRARLPMSQTLPPACDNTCCRLPNCRPQLGSDGPHGLAGGPRWLLTAELPSMRSRRAYGALSVCGRRWRAVLDRLPKP
jgi:Resolvase, N terminal domain